MKNYLLLFVFTLMMTGLQAQSPMATLEGYAFAANNEGYLNEVIVTIFQGNKELGQVVSNGEGKFEVELPIGNEYLLRATKSGFKGKELMASLKDAVAGKTVYTKVSMERSPGYIFEAALAEKKEGNDGTISIPSDGLTGATIEIYNNTKKKPELTLRKHKSHTFSHTFEKGNQYIILIRKEGFYTKRIQANVDVHGCILCFEGVGNVRPGVSDNLTAENTAGTLVANIDLRRVVVGESIEINNIYYNYGKWDITSASAMELDKLASILRDNPQLVVELGSHTDCRDLQAANQILSEKRAKSAVEYLVNEGEIDISRLRYKGYGEMFLKNKECDCNKAKPKAEQCSDEQHAINRRTEFKVIQVLQLADEAQSTLASSLMEQNMEDILKELENSVVQIPVDGVPPTNDSKPTNTSKPEIDAATADADAWQELMNPDNEIVEVPKDAPAPEVAEMSTEKPVIKTPKVEAPVIEKPVVTTPKVEAPVIEKPVVTTPKVEAPVIEKPVVTTPKVEAPKVNRPAIERPVVDAPKVEAPVVEAPVVKVPQMDRPGLGKGTAAKEKVIEKVEEVVEARPTLPVKSREEIQIIEDLEETVVEIPEPPRPVTDADAVPANVTYPNTDTNIASTEPANTSVEEVVATGKGAVKLPANYTGYKIQLIGAPSPLDKDHDIFNEFAFVTVQETMVGEYLYLIGDFRNGMQADAFLQRTILPRFPDAKVVHFQGGKRIN